LTLQATSDIQNKIHRKHRPSAHGGISKVTVYTYLLINDIESLRNWLKILTCMKYTPHVQRFGLRHNP
jgi:hypothetical protein